MTGPVSVGILVLIVALTMTMVGKGGGNFYVVILALSGVSMHESAATGQFILFAASVAAMIVFQRNRAVAWPLALLIGSFISVAALGGGYLSHLFSGFTLKCVFAVMLAIAGAVMLVPVPHRNVSGDRTRPGIWTFRSGDEVRAVDLRIVLPVTLLTGLASGMVGVSGGSFLVPLMVLCCGVPMRTAVGTASVLIAASALMGFAGHAAQGDFVPSLALPLAAVTIVGGLLGGRFALQTKPARLKQLFAYTNWIAAALMAFNAFKS